MTDVSRVTVSLPTPLLIALDRRLTTKGESRSAVVRRLVEQALREAGEQEEIQQYLHGYAEQPQTEEEFGWSDEVALANLARTARE